jgi:hypothetical protein
VLRLVPLVPKLTLFFYMHTGVKRSVDTGSTRGFTAKGHDHFGLFRPETGNEHVELDTRVVESRVGARTKKGLPEFGGKDNLERTKSTARC